MVEWGCCTALELAARHTSQSRGFQGSAPSLKSPGFSPVGKCGAWLVRQGLERVERETQSAAALSDYQASTDADEVDLQLIVVLLQRLCQDSGFGLQGSSNALGAILIFLPGGTQLPPGFWALRQVQAHHGCGLASRPAGGIIPRRVALSLMWICQVCPGGIDYHRMALWSRCLSRAA